MKAHRRSPVYPRPHSRSRTLLQTQFREIKVSAEYHRGPLTALALSVRAGARFDGRHPGLAHAVEHMLFQGTKHLDQQQLTEFAADLGGQHNAVTRYETITLIFECFNQDVEKALWLLADQYYHALIDEQRWRIERRVIIDELQGLESDPVQALEEAAFCRFFRGAIAHPITGSTRSLQALNATQIRRFLDLHFVHGATSIGVAGGVDPERVLQIVEKLFLADPRPVPSPPPVGQGITGTIRRHQPGGTVGYAFLLLEAPTSPREFFAGAVALEILGDGPDTRLFQEIRGKLGLGYAVNTGSTWGPDWAAFTIGASCPPQDVKLLRATIQSLCSDAADRGFRDQEFERARKKLSLNYALLGGSLFDRALILAEDPLLGFPLPEQAEEIIGSFSKEEVWETWRQVWLGRKLVALLT